MVIREPKCEPKIVFWGGILSRCQELLPCVNNVDPEYVLILIFSNSLEFHSAHLLYCETRTGI